MMDVTICNEIDGYISDVTSGKYPVCREQIALCKYVQRKFSEEDIRVDTAQLERYLKNEKYFGFKLFPWEKFIFTLHNCVYRADGLLRWPTLFAEIGRGAGKTGYLAFEEFCWITPINGIKEYNVDIFATSEHQARTSHNDIYNMLEDNKAAMSKYFYWTMEVIRNKKTMSEIRYHTSNAKTKDGGRPGAVVFDEYHAYEDYKLVDVANTGLGKKALPRKTIMTTDGHVRGGPLDDMKERAEAILFGDADDNGLLPFICKLDDKKEVDNKELWQKANPSLIYFPALYQELLSEYADYKLNPLNSSSFMVKRMDISAVDGENSVTTWDNILACKKSIPDLSGCDCVAGLDYMKTTDFLTAGLLFKHSDIYYWIQHSWAWKNCPDLPRIKAPLKEWEEKGYLTFVDGAEIDPDIPAQWLEDMAQKYNVTVMGIDNFRITLMKRALGEHGFDTDKNGANNIRLVKRVTENRYVPTITSLFNTHRIGWGDDPMMGWYTNNACIIEEKGNQYYGKKESKSRKTDGFSALVAAICAADDLEDSANTFSFDDLKVITF